MEAIPASRWRLASALLLSGLLHAALLASLLPALSTAPVPPPGLQLQLQPAAAHGAQPVHAMPSTAQGPAAPSRHPPRQSAAAVSRPATPPLLTSPAPDSLPLGSAKAGSAAESKQAATTPSATGSTTAPAIGSNKTGGADQPGGQPGSATQPALYRTAYLHNPEPPYPARSRELGEQGQVQLRVRVSAQGQALQVDIVSSSHSRRLDQAAREAVANWRFQPARQGGLAIESNILVPVSFVLQSP